MDDKKDEKHAMGMYDIGLFDLWYLRIDVQKQRYIQRESIVETSPLGYCGFEGYTGTLKITHF